MASSLFTNQLQNGSFQSSNQNQGLTDRPIAFDTLDASFRLHKKPFVQVDVILFGFFILIFMIFGIFANLLTMLVICNSRKLRTIFHFFIFSMCASDLISALISWVNWYRRTLGFDHFSLPNSICVIYRSFDIWTSYATALHILSFAVLRLIGLKFPMTLNRIKDKQSFSLAWIILLWVITFGCGEFPFILMNGAISKERNSTAPYSKWPACTVLPEWFETYRSYTHYTFPIFFYIPIIFTIIVSAFVAILMTTRGLRMKRHISSSALKKRNKKDKRAVYQLALIVTSFMVGYLPFTVFEFTTATQRNDTYANWWFDWHFGTTQYVFLRFSECLNPVFYNLGSRTMWRETKRFCVGKCGCSRQPRTKRDRSRSVTQSTDTYNRSIS